MIELTCEQCKKSFEGMTKRKRFCGGCVNARHRRGSQERRDKMKNDEPRVTIGGLTPCKWCARPIRVTSSTKRIHDRCKAEYERMMSMKRYHRNRKGKRLSKRRWTEPINTNVTPEMLKDLDKLCKKNQTHVANMLRLLIKREVKRLEKGDI